MSTKKLAILCSLIGIHGCGVSPAPRDTVYEACFPWTVSNAGTDGLITATEAGRREGFSEVQTLNDVNAACQETCFGVAQPCLSQCTTCGVAVVEFVY